MLTLIVYHPAAEDVTEQVQARIADTTSDYLRLSPHAWLVSSNDSVDIWAGRLCPPVRGDDHLFIAHTVGHSNGWLDDTDWSWINNHST